MSSKSRGHSVISVAKKAGLDAQNRGDVEALVSATACSWNFARSVLQAINDGSEHQKMTKYICHTKMLLLTQGKIDYIFMYFINVCLSCKGNHELDLSRNNSLLPICIFSGVCKPQVLQ